MNQKNEKVNPPSQIFLKFKKQTELFMLIPTNCGKFFLIG